ncbi:hypothetical protein [Acetobacter orleanensis]|uniref:Uncharacterized protein n=1 Tax=Acetobacter orleanensis TaxID=104099 RepID=A0A4Y3TN25_9PROT|nr:hypothetical protein [Acetobacter orleanensis]KXV63927.1 hypothetical protein AD949_06375 [Acetobacter orleanensis]PCD79698.1 hypothetical protein CO710_05695 [Acetobacter orleanensis]GAN69259.1 hypothetical protein Abol_030_024 [Acetobacter orleanensis JCM 7639]GBR28208.1 hypothetical protein AA0473_1674 [Acetobacter orleanensis NRIC 0473]GEB82215.1 hypothetical protein AOR01nite_06920 [Acetobacter orleanensis]
MNSVIFDVSVSILAVLWSVLAGVSVYLSAPRQMMVRKALPARTGLGLAGVSAVMALWLFCQVAGVLTSVFALVVVLMSVWSFLPLCVALLRRRQGAS